MYSKEEARRVRQDFWTMFGKRYHRKWLLYNTGVKDLNLKFDFEEKRALIAIDIEHIDPIFRAYYYEKFESLKGLMLEAISADLIFDPDYVLPSGKVIARIYVQLEGVKIQRKTDWPKIYAFFFAHMDKLESFYLEYQDFIKD